MLRNLENRGNPWGVQAQRPRGLDQGARLRGADGRRPARLRRRVPVLGRLRRRHRRPREEGHQGRRGAAAHRRRRVRRPRLGRDLLGRPGPPHGQRVRVPDAGPGERRDPQRRLRGPRPGHAEDRHHLPALLQLAGPRVPAARRRVRGRPPHPAAQPARGGGPAHAGDAGRPQGHLPRPVLPGPAQQGLHAPAGDPRLRPGPVHAGDAPLQGPRLLLRRRRCPHVDGGEDRQADQHGAHRGGPRASTPTSSPPPARSASRCCPTR